ncbi:spore gernimation protein GerPD [Paenibacillus sp. sgz500958]|uniref:spore gernimation protein GerPD n=1 Tax=Paenibacillus sp. sgz500958 TaxID=3242475 RepID=UPI0036D399A6
MKVTIVNGELKVGSVKVISIAGSSVFLVGDSQNIYCSSQYDSKTENADNSGNSDSEAETPGKGG